MKTLKSTLVSMITVFFLLQTVGETVGNEVNSKQVWATKAKARKTTAVWIIKGFSNFALITSPTFYHEIKNLNWTVSFDRVRRQFGVNLHGYKPEETRDARISLNIETCDTTDPFSYLTTNGVRWIYIARASEMARCIPPDSALCYSFEWTFEFKDFSKIDNTLIQAQDLTKTRPWCEDTVQVHAELTIFEDEKHASFKCGSDQSVADCLGVGRDKTTTPNST